MTHFLDQMETGKNSATEEFYMEEIMTALGP
jgi:hypothetical protein